MIISKLWCNYSCLRIVEVLWVCKTREPHLWNHRRLLWICGLVSWDLNDETVREFQGKKNHIQRLWGEKHCGRSEKFRMILCLVLPGSVLVIAYCPGLINHDPFHSHKCLGLKNDIHVHPRETLKCPCGWYRGTQEVQMRLLRCQKTNFSWSWGKFQKFGILRVYP